MAKQKKLNQTCKECGCTDTNCKICIEKTGEPCFWVEKDLCSACAFKDIWPELKALEIKGDRVGLLLDKCEKISLEMEQIFIDHNVNHLDTRALPEEASALWHQLHKYHSNIGLLMTKIING